MTQASLSEVNAAFFASLRNRPQETKGGGDGPDASAANSKPAQKRTRSRKPKADSEQE